MLRRAALSGLAALGLNATAQAQAPARNQVVMMREIDADRYDPHRSTALAAGEVLTLMGDTLVSMDFDGRTIRPRLWPSVGRCRPTAGSTPSTCAATSPSATASP
jgi:peptide/nickel transport system substrate-binding protein